MVSSEEIWRAGSGASGRSIRFLTSPQRLQVARANTLLPREKRAFFLQRVAGFHLRGPSHELRVAAARSHVFTTPCGYRLANWSRHPVDPSLSGKQVDYLDRPIGQGFWKK